MSSRQRTVAVLVVVALGGRTGMGLERVVIQQGGNAVVVNEPSRELPIQFIFGSARTMEAARESAAAKLRDQTDAVARLVCLSAGQRARLELAGQGDIHRFLNEFTRVMPADTGGTMSMEELQQVHLDMVPLLERYHGGLHGEGSLFQKTMPTTLSAMQLSAIQEREREHYRDLVRTVVLQLDKIMRLTAEECEQLVEIVTEMTESIPPYYSWSSHSKDELRAVLQQIAGMERELKPIVGEDQWPRMQRFLTQQRVAQQLQLQQAIILRQMGDRVILKRKVP